MQDLIPRAPRLQRSLPLSFTTDEGRFAGRALDVSETGMLCSFATRPEIWTTGELALEAAEHLITLKARVVRLQPDGAGLHFIIHTDNDRLSVQLLLTSN